MTGNQDQLRPNLYIVGFMGTGKSAVGRAIAQRLDYEYIDSDNAIEKSEGRSIREIFESDGESVFRDLEKRFVEEGHPSLGCVVSSGGGLISQPGMLAAIQSKGPVFCLLASAETIFERVRGNKKRPLLNVEDPMARIRELLKEREPIYKNAGTEVLTDGRSISDIASHIVRIYRTESRSWGAR